MLKMLRNLFWRSRSNTIQIKRILKYVKPYNIDGEVDKNGKTKKNEFLEGILRKNGR